MAEKQPVKDALWSWIVLASVTTIVFLGTGMTKCFSVLLPDLREQLSSHSWIIGSCISVVYGSGYVIGMTSGSLLTRFGARMTLVVSGCLTCTGLIVCANATNVYHVLCGSLLLGFVYVEENIVVGMLSHYFNKHFAVAMSIVLLGGDLPIVVMAPLTHVLLEPYGWRGAMVLLSALTLHSVPCSIILKGNSKQTRSQGVKASLLLGNERTSGKKITGGCFRICTIIDCSVLMQRTFVLRVLIPGFAWGYSFNGWLIYTVSYAMSNGATMREATFLSTCAGIGVILARLIMPLINKYLGYEYLAYASLLLASASLGLATVWVTLIGMYTSSLMFGVASSLLSASAYMAAQDIVSDDEYVHAVSWFHLVYGFASILASAVSGLIYDVTGSFQISFVVLAAVPLISILPLGLHDLQTRLSETKNVKL